VPLAFRVQVQGTTNAQRVDDIAPLKPDARTGASQLQSRRSSSVRAKRVQRGATRLRKDNLYGWLKAKLGPLQGPLERGVRRQVRGLTAAATTAGIGTSYSSPRLYAEMASRTASRIASLA